MCLHVGSLFDNKECELWKREAPKIKKGIVFVPGSTRFRCGTLYYKVCIIIILKNGGTRPKYDCKYCKYCTYLSQRGLGQAWDKRDKILHQACNTNICNIYTNTRQFVSHWHRGCEKVLGQLGHWDRGIRPLAKNPVKSAENNFFKGSNYAGNGINFLILHQYYICTKIRSKLCIHVFFV